MANRKLQIMNDDNYTPVKCSETKEYILLGDKVKDFKGNNGFLAWDEFFNSYYIKTIEGGKINTRNYIKISDLKENYFDSTTVECRNNHLKKKW